MREQHPVDDLFARNLRDAQVPPPPEVWQGIALARNGRRDGWFRRWPWLVLLVAAGSLATYQFAVEDAPADHLAVHPAPNEYAALPNLDDMRDPRNGNLVPHPEGRSTPLNNKAHAGGGTIQSSVRQEPVISSPEQDLTHNREEHRHERLARDADMDTDRAFTNTTPHLVDGPADPEKGPEQALAQVQYAFHAFANAPGTGLPLPVEHTYGPFGSGNDGPGWMESRWPERTGPMLSGPQRGLGPALADAPHAWWLAATIGLYGEHRKWKGNDEVLVQALQGTEVLHPASSFGLLLGRESHSGWNMAIGLEYLASRFHFNHLDKFTTRHDSLVTFVITFNNQVLSSYLDTLSTYSQVQQPVSAVNRVSTLRVPMELGWHSAYRRFHWGARAGLAIERNSIHSGATLSNTVHGIRSEYPVANGDRTSWLIDGSMALDLGYALSERFGLWASPTLSIGLLSLSRNEAQPYAMPGRAGLRFRLAYTLIPTHR